ncbi:MAG: hypothetical protein AAF823_07305 [Planctomycetota bacterium]
MNRAFRVACISATLALPIANLTSAEATEADALETAQAELAELRETVDELQRKVAELEHQLSQIKLDAIDAEPDEAIGLDEPQAATSAPTRKIYRSLEELFRDMPAELRPDRVEGWDPYAKADALSWVHRQAGRVIFDIRREVRSVTPRRDVNAGTSQPLIGIDGESFTWMGMRVREKWSAIRLRGGRELADGIGDRLRPGTDVRIIGVPARLTFSEFTGPGIRVVWHVAAIEHPWIAQLHDGVTTEEILSDYTQSPEASEVP